MVSVSLREDPGLSISFSCSPHLMMSDPGWEVDWIKYIVCVVCCSVAQSCPTLCNPHRLQHCRLPCPSPSLSLLKRMSFESVMASNLCHPLLLLPSIFPNLRVFSIESALWIWWQKYWSFSFSISPSNEYSGLISFRIDSFDLLDIKGTLKTLLQHHSWKHQFFGTQPFLWWSYHSRIWLLKKP